MIRPLRQPADADADARRRREHLAGQVVDATGLRLWTGGHFATVAEAVKYAAEGASTYLYFSHHAASIGQTAGARKVGVEAEAVETSLARRELAADRPAPFRPEPPCTPTIR